MQLKFADFLLDPLSGELVRAGQPVTVEPQVFRLLTHLVENRDRVVSKDELIEAVWDGRIVSDGTLNSRINSLRRALGDDGKSQSLIRTISRRGFRFVAQIEEPIAPAAPVSDESVQKPAVAVLPFTNLSDDSEQEYFSDGVAEDITSALSRFGWFFVIARNSSFSYKGQNVDVRKIAQELGARYILDGSTRRIGNRLRLSVQLADGETGNQIWSEKYDRKLDDIFAVQDEIAMTVVGAIEPAVEFAEIERAKNKISMRLDVWDLFMRGKAKIHLYTPDDLTEAAELLENVIEHAPDFALAHAVLAFTYQRQIVFEYAEEPEATLRRARELAEKGVMLSRDDADTQTALGWVRWTDGEVDDSVAILRAAVALNPSHADAHSLLGIALTFAGKAEEGLRHHETAIRLSPRDPAIAIMYGRYANTCVFASHYEDAVNFGKHAIHLSNGRFWMPYINTISGLGHLDRLEEARNLTNRLRAVNPDIGPKTLRHRYQFADPAGRARYFFGLHKAGWEI